MSSFSLGVRKFRTWRNVKCRVALPFRFTWQKMRIMSVLGTKISMTQLWLRVFRKCLNKFMMGAIRHFFSQVFLFFPLVIRAIALFGVLTLMRGICTVLMS